MVGSRLRSSPHPCFIVEQKLKDCPPLLGNDGFLCRWHVTEQKSRLLGDNLLRQGNAEAKYSDPEAKMVRIHLIAMKVFGDESRLM